QASVLELLDRLISTGIVLDGEIDIGLAELSLINLKLRLLLTSSSEVKLRGGNG
ncbi:MAG: gas vesicle protein GvpJ, partial [Pseudanabaenaceae cyanobacterium]